MWIPAGGKTESRIYMTEEIKSFTPREIVSELDRFIVGQSKAKRAVAIALRNRWRRQRVDPNLRDEIAPKNIILIGPTGCGKTEIARRLAKLAEAPFVKVEATKFTEVGYVGRDVDSMVRDLVEVSMKLCREKALELVKAKAQTQAEERVLDLLLPAPKTKGPQTVPFDIKAGEEARIQATPKKDNASREKMRELLRAGNLDEKEVNVEITPPKTQAMFHMFGQTGGMEDMASNLQDALGQAMGGKRKKRQKIKIKEALDVLAKEEAAKLIDQDAVQRDALKLAENHGIIFIDEIDKVAGRGGSGRGPDVSREGVQRDILPIVEGSTVSTKHGQIKTDHILFIAAGAFHVAKPTDLIPELQGRFPIRVELESLTQEDFVRILKEPEASLVKQYRALLETEGFQLIFEDDGIDELARVAQEVNTNQENIGARRLYTVMEKMLEEESFYASDKKDQELVINQALVCERLAPILENEDLSKFIL